MSLKKYIVGGWVRDKLLTELGHPIQSNDKDWVVTGATPEEMLRLNFVPVGNDFPVFLHPKTHEEYALARTERKSGHGYKGFTFFADPSVTLEQEVRKVFAPMERRKKELEAAAQALETDYSEEAVTRYTAMEEKFKEDGGYYFEKEYDVIIRKFGFSEEERKKPLSEFSGGQQTKIAFIKLLLSKPDILLLDEPTNHLDITTIEWLETYLKNYPKAVVVVSHDRMFLDNVVDVVYEIEYGTATRYPGNYSNFMERKKENYNKMMKDYNAQQKEIARLQRIVDRFKNKPTKVSMAHSKEKAIEHMVKLEAPDRFDTRTFHANFQPDKETGKALCGTN